MQKEQDKINDLKKHIRDLEMELEFMYVREPNQVRYISDIENKVDQLYKELDSIIYNE